MLSLVLIAGAWRPAREPLRAFNAFDPATGVAWPELYPVSGMADVELACRAGAEAARELAVLPPERLAEFLEDYARRIEAGAEPLVEVAARETGYPVSPRLREVELPRTTGQLRQAAAAAREGSWSLPTIDTRADIRSHHAALGGPVAVFGPSNFPLAFNAVSGGDFAAAIAAGNPVIAKAHPGYPATSRLLAEWAFEAIVACDLPRATLQLLYHLPNELGAGLVSHPLLAASAFTGKKSSGLALKSAAERAGKLIYLELSSVNPVFVLPGALAERGAAIARELADSCLLGAGQFCTRPGLAVVQADAAAEGFFAELRARLELAPSGTLLSHANLEGISAALGELTRHGAEIACGGAPLEAARACFANTLLRAPGAALLAAPEPLQSEAFAAVNTSVFCDGAEQMLEVAGALHGSLTGSIYSQSQGADDAFYERLSRVLRPKVGRLLNDRMPTGVAVSPAMNHGGPYPATGHPGFTAVGLPASLRRFSALHCYDHVRSDRLPPALRDRNPNGVMWRNLDGVWSQGDVGG